jgi:hypothetical protein
VAALAPSSAVSIGEGVRGRVGEGGRGGASAPPAEHMEAAASRRRERLARMTGCYEGGGGVVRRIFVARTKTEEGGWRGLEGGKGEVGALPFRHALTTTTTVRSGGVDTQPCTRPRKASAANRAQPSGEDSTAPRDFPKNALPSFLRRFACLRAPDTPRHSRRDKLGESPTPKRLGGWDVGG